MAVENPDFIRNPDFFCFILNICLFIIIFFIILPSPSVPKYYPDFILIMRVLQPE